MHSRHPFLLLTMDCILFWAFDCQLPVAAMKAFCTGIYFIYFHTMIPCSFLLLLITCTSESRRTRSISCGNIFRFNVSSSRCIFLLARFSLSQPFRLPVSQRRGRALQAALLCSVTIVYAVTNTKALCVAHSIARVIAWVAHAMYWHYGWSWFLVRFISNPILLYDG